MTWDQWFGIVGSTASVVGLGVSIIVLRSVANLRDRFRRQGMIEVCLGNLQRSRDSLIYAIEEKDSSQVISCLAEIKATIERLRLHIFEDLNIEWDTNTIDAAMATDGRSRLSSAKKVLPLVHHWIAAIELRLRETMWGNEHD